MGAKARIVFWSAFSRIITDSLRSVLKLETALSAGTQTLLSENHSLEFLDGENFNNADGCTDLCDMDLMLMTATPANCAGAGEV